MDRDAVRRPGGGSRVSRTRHASLPPRVDNLAVRDLGFEIIAINAETNEAHCLSGVAAAVFRVAGTDAAVAAPEGEIQAAMSALVEKGLLTKPSGFSRRALLQRTGLVVAATGIAT